MSEPRLPHPQNVAGPFYVEHGCCTACDMPMVEAPGLFAYDANSHCFVKRQPVTTDEITRAICTVWAAEFACIRYRGTDPDVLRRLAELDLRDRCDTEPPAHIQPVIRNHVTFTLIGAPEFTTPRKLAGILQDYLTSQNNEWRQFKCESVRSSSDEAWFEFAWYADQFHPVEYHATRESGSEWHVCCPLRNLFSDRGAVNVVFDWLASDHSRFTNLKWYTDRDWHGSKAFQSTPW